MYFPTRDEFREKSRDGNLIPVYKEILGDLETPVSAFRKISDGEYAFLLESVESGENVGRHSFLGSEPFLVFQSKGRHGTIQRIGREPETIAIAPNEDPLTVLKSLLGEYRWVPVAGLPPFSGGAVGYLAFNGNVDTCITIRTILMRDGIAHLQAGAGIVADSDPTREWEETRHKAQALGEAIEMAELGK